MKDLPTGYDWKLVYRKEAGHVITEEYEAPAPSFGEDAYIHAVMTIEPHSTHIESHIIY